MPCKKSDRVIDSGPEMLYTEVKFVV